VRRLGTADIDVAAATSKSTQFDCDSGDALMARSPAILAGLLIFCLEIRRSPFQKTCRRDKLPKVSIPKSHNLRRFVGPSRNAVADAQLIV
jgi:hypothetical protein